MNKQKYIALIDCDSFFVSCERRKNPDLNNLAVCVTSGEKGCIISRSKEAKSLGIPMGIPLFMAKEKFSDCIYINADHFSYCEISNEIMSILKEISPTVEVYSIDEAFVDLTGLCKLYKKNYYDLAKYIKETIFERTNIPVSIGISRSKVLAKLASDKSKNTDSHIFLAGKASVKKLLLNSEIGEVWGIGRRLEPKLRGYGIKTAYDFIAKDDIWLKSKFGINLLEIKYELLGESVNKVSNGIKLPKSIMNTKSFREFSNDINFIKNELMIHIHSACKKLRRADSKCKTIGVILKAKDFKVYFDKINLEYETNFEFEISESALLLLEKIYSPNILYRSVGILLENFNSAASEQINLFLDAERKLKNEKLAKSLDKLEQKFGRNIVKPGFTGHVDYKQDFISKS
ncbi:hypothetical protein IJO12_01710 [bacterium]|nr:hypothetical protein [bacterium]